MPWNRRKIYIENMLSRRCKKIVVEALESLGLDSIVMELGEVTVDRSMTSAQRHELNDILVKSGLKLLDEEKTRLIERVMTLIDEKIHQTTPDRKITFSSYLSENLDCTYNYLASLFSRVKGITIENYIIECKIERVKELMLYNDYNLTEISYIVDYSSVAHLSTQFKKVTGLTPSEFKNLNSRRSATKFNFHPFTSSLYLNQFPEFV